MHHLKCRITRLKALDRRGPVWREASTGLKLDGRRSKLQGGGPLLASFAISLMERLCRACRVVFIFVWSSFLKRRWDGHTTR